MHTEQNAPHNHSKLCPCPPLTPTTLEIIQAYFKQINPPLGHKSKNKKYTHLLKFNFKWGLFYKNCKILQKNYPLQPPFQYLQLCIWAPNKKIHAHTSVCLVKSFPKWYDTTR